MNTERGAHDKCRDGDACQGPGCRKHSGLTARNADRAHPNRTNVGAQRDVARSGKKAMK